MPPKGLKHLSEPHWETRHDVLPYPIIFEEDHSNLNDRGFSLASHLHSGCYKDDEI
jgi:hypothetical protein